MQASFAGQEDRSARLARSASRSGHCSPWKARNIPRSHGGPASLASHIGTAAQRLSLRCSRPRLQEEAWQPAARAPAPADPFAPSIPRHGAGRTADHPLRRSQAAPRRAFAGTGARSPARARSRQEGVLAPPHVSSRSTPPPSRPAPGSLPAQPFRQRRMVGRRAKQGDEKQGAHHEQADDGIAVQERLHRRLEAHRG